MRTSPKSIARMSLNNTIILADLREQEREFLEKKDNCKKIRNSFVNLVSRIIIIIINNNSSFY